MTQTIPLSTWLICYAATLFVFLIVDLLWLGLVAKDFYAGQLGSLMAENVRWGVAICFYALYIVGILIFASHHGLSGGSIGKAALYGAMFGFFCYATYDLTNLATLEGWPVKMVVVDIVWGTGLTATCAAGGVWITRLVTGS
ncbi:MAG: DUF2177 family protein [Litorimonas sp.]